MPNKRRRPDDVTFVPRPDGEAVILRRYFRGSEMLYCLGIVSRAVDDASVAKLIRAGADRAISPYAIGGHRRAHLILSPTVVDFFETALAGLIDPGVVNRAYAVYEGSAALRAGPVDVLPLPTFLDRLSAGEIIG